MFGGIISVIEKLKIGEVIISKQYEDSKNYQVFKKVVKERKIKVTEVSKGDRINIEKNVYIDILWPNNKKIIGENILNNNSIVCKVCNKDFSCLFTGDIEEIAEKEILEEYKNNKSILKSTVLKVAHHGSRTSSSQEFITLVKPRIALIGVGKNNKFGHPNDEVIKRIEMCGSKIYRTDVMGEIIINIHTNGKIRAKKHLE